MNIVSHDTQLKVQEALVHDFVTYIAQYKKNKLLFFYSGGSVLELFPLLYDFLFKENITKLNAWFVPIDERFDVSASNFKAFAALECFRGFESMGVRFLDVLSHGHLLEDSAYWFSEWVRVETDQVHIADGKVISLFGMGADGHMAGIFPFPENEAFFNGEFIETSRFAVGYDVGEKNPYTERITTTLPAFKTMDRSFAYVLGVNKKSALERVLSQEGSYSETPARIWRELSEHGIYTDISL